MSEFLSNQLFWGLMSDGDYGLPVPADMMYGEVIPHTETFSECISRATNCIFSLNGSSPARALQKAQGQGKLLNTALHRR